MLKPTCKVKRPPCPTLLFQGDMMNSLEKKYALFLEEQKIVGEILLWRFEKIKLQLAKSTWYTPDFYIVDKEGQISMHETKGFWRDDARVKIKVAAQSYPEINFVAVQWKNKQWSFENF